MSKNLPTDDKVPVEDLTWREQEVLALLAERQTNREIVGQLHLAESTVKDYVSIILGKLYVKNRRQAVERAQELGLLGIDRGVYSGSPSNLPAETTMFIGREEELLEISRLLREVRLVTLTGPGGIGKTRLALKVAQEALGEFDQGVYFVSLAPLQSADDIVQTTAEALNFPLASHGDPLQQLLRYLITRQLLLVMDNFEHLLDGSETVTDIIQAETGVKILATSRERLNIQGETVYPVTGMDLPDPEGVAPNIDSDALALFVSSAKRIHPLFKPTPVELRLIAQICQIVDGMPLAIELAASWLHVLSLEEILVELKENIDLLVTEMRDVPERQRSIRAVFENTWALLEPAEQEVFKRLAVFRDGFTREAAQEVVGATLSDLGVLVNKSIIRYGPRRRRYEIHELLRQYAQAELEKSPKDGRAALQRHAVYFAEFMDIRWIYLRDERQLQALNEVEADHENIRAAWRYYLHTGAAGQMRRFIYSFWLVYWAKGWHLAAVEMFRDAVAALQKEGRSREEEIVWATSLAYQAFFMCWLGLADEAFPMAVESMQALENLQDFDGLVAAYDSLTLAAYYMDDISTEKEGLIKLIDITHREEEPWSLTFALSIGAATSLRAGEYDAAEKYAEAGIKLREETGELFSSIVALLTLGHLYRIQEDLTQAEEYYRQSLLAAERLGFYWGIENAVKYLGQTMLLGGRLAEAEANFMRSLRIAFDLGLKRDIANHLYEISRLRIAQGRPEEAVGLLGLLLRQAASRQARLGAGSIQESAEALLEELKTELDPDVYAAAEEKGAKNRLG